MPGWDNQKAGTIFEQMLIKTGNKIDGVAAANDGIANAVVVALKAHKLKPIPLSGQDATHAGRAEHHLGLADDDGVQGRPQAGDRGREGRGRDRQGHRSSRRRARSRRRAAAIEPAYLIPPQSITKANYKLLFTSGFLKKERRLQRRRTRSTASSTPNDRRRRPAAGASVRPVV